MTKDIGEEGPWYRKTGSTAECAALTREVTLSIGSIKFEVVPPSTSKACTMYHETECQRNT